MRQAVAFAPRSDAWTTEVDRIVRVTRSDNVASMTSCRPAVAREWLRLTGGSAWAVRLSRVVLGTT